MKNLDSKTPIVSLKAASDKFSINELSTIIPALRGYNLEPRFRALPEFLAPWSASKNSESSGSRPLSRHGIVSRSKATIARSRMRPVRSKALRFR